MGQEAPSRSILNHPHPWSLPAGSSDPGQARDRQGRGNALGSQAFGIQQRRVNAQARAGEGRGEGREPADLIDPSTRDACTPPSESAYPSPCPSPARERGPAPCSRRLAPPSAESAQGSEPDASVPTRLPNAFPWEDALAVGLGVLGWRPGDFWSATPREFAAALGPRAQPEALTRAGFEDLLAAYPDRT
ncbi:phage tail assembly chaperone [Methylobacterium sp. GC_Met_3]|uniref:phage tail assembly chaperone n=1 Tax=Methylobacterium sp. GC_Met_3 TaxID=2937375 RepID=UPI00226AAD3E